jgi:hypothetical protein
MRRLVVLLALVLVGAAPAAATRSHASLPPLPHGWPATLQIGLTDSPGGAAALRKSAPFGFRYQYLAGGVNTGQGWATWNPHGTFASMYVHDSWAHHVIPVLTYYMLLQSKPTGSDEAKTDLAHLHSPAVMRAYWKDVRLLFKCIRGSKPVVVHVEPDFWGYLEQASKHDDAATVPGAVHFAQEWVRLRDELAPSAILAYHMSGWGTKHDIVYEKPPDATVRKYAARSAHFYRSLHARFDISFEDYSDRDAGFYQVIEGNPNTWFKPADFHRHLLYGETFVRLARLRMVAWQIPLGNTLMRAMNNSWGHYQDNRVQWLLGPDWRAHLGAYVRAGYAGFLFGGGADGTTCACDAQGDGVTNPAPIDGNTRVSLSTDDDGGYFRAQVRAYYHHGALRLSK